MGTDRVTVWFDKEGDYLEVIFVERAGYMRATENDAVMERVDQEGNIIGFSVLGISQLSTNQPLIAQLTYQA